MNINEKIIDSVQKTTGLRCYEGEPGQLVRGSFAYFYPLQTASRGNEVAIFFFTRPTIERLDRRRSLDYAMTMANRWLNGLYTYSGLKFADVVSQNQFQDTGGGYGIGMRVVLIDEARNVGGVSVDRVLLTLSVDPIGSATLSGAGKYIKGNNATAGATALHGFTFSKWTNGTSDVSTDNPYTFEIDTDTSLVAVCTRNNYTLSLSSGTGISGVSGGGTYPYETQVTATATVAHGFTFSNWTSSGTVVSTSNPYTFSLLDNTSLVANTTRNNYTVTLSEATQGTTSSLVGSGVYPYETSVTVEAVPVTGYEFIKWTDGTSDVSTSNPYTFSLTDDTSLVAVCDIATYRVVFGEPYPSGSFQTLSGNGTYEYGATVTLSATMNHGYSFNGWSILDSTYYDNPYTFQIYGDTEVTPMAAANSYTVATSVNDQTMGSASGGGSYNYNTSCTLTATPENGYHLVNWTVNGTVVSTSNPYTFTVEDDTTVQANFAIDAFTVTTAVNDQTMGSATGGGQYSPGTTATVVATPTSGYEFVEWQVGGSTVSTNTTYSFTVTQDVTVTAVFRAEIKWFTVTALNNGFTMTMNKASGVSADPLEYSTDLTTWTTYTNNTTISLNANKSVYFRNRGGTYRGQGCYWSGSLAYYGYSCKQTSSGKTYKVSGHLATLFDPDESGDYQAYYVSLFNGETGLVDASGLVMDGVNKMYDNSAMYYRMFYGCTALVHGPKYIPQPRLGSSGNKDYQLAFNNMFQNCTSLVDVPSMDNVSIPVEVNIYRSSVFEYMFSGCTSLEDASDFIVPVSSFTSQGTNTNGSNLGDGHFRYMFYGCTSLVHGPTIGTENSTFSIQSISNTSYRVAASPFDACFYGCIRLQDVTLNFVSMTNAWNAHNSSYNSSSRKWNTSYAFNNWLGNVAAEGTVYSKTAISPTGSTSNLPTGWTNTIIS